jgi:hypothetical protein
MIVEILSFAGCPNDGPARDTVERIIRELGLDVDVVMVNVPDLETAERMRFLGSPTIRVDGRDVEPGADGRSDYLMGCRVFRTEAGLRGQPDERWIRTALREAAGV